MITFVNMLTSIQELVDDMYKKLDANSDGIVVWTEFRDYFLRYGLQVQAV